MAKNIGGIVVIWKFRDFNKVRQTKILNIKKKINNKNIWLG